MQQFLEDLDASDLLDLEQLRFQLEPSSGSVREQHQDTISYNPSSPPFLEEEWYFYRKCLLSFFSSTLLTLAQRTPNILKLRRWVSLP